VIRIETRGFEKLAHDLSVAKSKAFPYAQRDAVNEAAFVGRWVWSGAIRETFVTRNTFTAGRALEVVKAKAGTGRVEAVLGSTADYMALQEKGGTVRGKSGHRPIAAPTAAGQAAGSRRTKLVRKGMKLSAIKAVSVGKTRGRLQRNATAMAMARRGGKKFAVLERPSGGPGIFLISGTKKKLKARLVWDLSRRSAQVPPHRTLEPTLQRVRPRMPDMYAKALLKQLKHHHVFGY
jgi:hypothetical protein